jgi:hypothetical protein
LKQVRTCSQGHCLCAGMSQQGATFQVRP